MLQLSQLITWLLKGIKRRENVTGSTTYSIEICFSPFFVLKLQAKRPPHYLTFEEWKWFELAISQTSHTIFFIFSSSPGQFTDCCSAKELGSQLLPAFSLLGKKYYLQYLTGRVIVEAKQLPVIALGRTCEALRNVRAKSKKQASVSRAQTSLLKCLYTQFYELHTWLENNKLHEENSFPWQL